MRHMVVESSNGGSWYVCDTVLGRLVWVHPNESLAKEMAYDLNEIHEKGRPTPLVDVEVLNRTRESISTKVAEAIVQEAVALNLLRGGDAESAGWADHAAWLLRQEANDLRHLVTSLGFRAA